MNNLEIIHNAIDELIGRIRAMPAKEFNVHTTSDYYDGYINAIEAIEKELSILFKLTEDMLIAEHKR